MSRRHNPPIHIRSTRFLRPIVISHIFRSLSPSNHLYSPEPIIKPIMSERHKPKRHILRVLNSHLPNEIIPNKRLQSFPCSILIRLNTPYQSKSLLLLFSHIMLINSPRFGLTRLSRVIINPIQIRILIQLCIRNSFRVSSQMILL